MVRKNPRVSPRIKNRTEKRNLQNSKNKIEEDKLEVVYPIKNSKDCAQEMEDKIKNLEKMKIMFYNIKNWIQTRKK